MEITLDLPDRVLRKVKALHVLRGGEANIEPLLIELIDGVLTTSIAEQLGMDSPSHVGGYVGPQVPAYPPKRPTHVDVSGITDGLGDDEEIGEEHDAEALVAGSGGLSDEDLIRDMMVDDPSMEAKVEAPDHRGPRVGAETLFADIAGMPQPPELSLRQQRRKKEVKSNGRVSLATSAGAEL